MTEKRFRVFKIDEMYGVSDDKAEYTVAWDNSKLIIDNLCDLLNALHEENEQLKEALREELQDNGNAYYIEIFDKLFNLNYDEWDRNERYRECTDWEKVLKDKGDVE